MLQLSWLALAAIALAPAAHAASGASPTTDPSQPSAPTTVFQYESVIKTYQTAPQDDATPGQTWRAANEEVGRIGGHAGYMKAHDASTYAGHSTPAASQSKATPPAQAAKPTASGNGKDGGHHGMHH